MILLIIVLCIIIILETIIFLKYQRQVRNICRQLKFVMKNDSNMLITGEIFHGGFGELIETLNQILVVRRNEKKHYMDKEKAISDTYTNISHDIRTPLTSLDGYFQLLRYCKSAQEQEHYIEIIEERIHSLNEMLEELFLFTKLKNESYQLKLEICCVNQVVKQTIFSYFDEWIAKGIEPDIQITNQLLYMNGNEQAIRRCLQNVIKNALDHGTESLGIYLGEEEGKICIKIWNKVENPETIDTDKVFVRFYKADEARSRTSSGLGLSIAKEFVELMDGEIRAEFDNNLFYIIFCFNIL